MDVEILKLLIDKNYYDISGSLKNLENIARKISPFSFINELNWKEAEKLENEFEIDDTYPYEEAYQHIKETLSNIIEGIKELESTLEMLESY